MNRENALRDIARIAQQNGLSAEDIAAHMIAQGDKTPAGQAGMLIALLSYLGGLLVFCGIGFFIALQWDIFDSFSRVLITYGPGLIALILGIATLKDPRYIKASTPLFLIAAFMQPLGFFVLLREYFQGDDAAMAAMIVFAPMTMQMLALFYKLKRGSLLFFTLAYGCAFFSAAMNKAGMDGDMVATALGLSGLMLSGVINRTAHRGFVPFTYFIFALCFAAGMFEIVEDTGADVLLIGVGGLMMFASVKAQSRAFLCASVMTMMAYLGYFTTEYFADTVGWPLALIAIGLTMIGLSAYAIKLGKNIGHAAKG